MKEFAIIYSTSTTSKNMLFRPLLLLPGCIQSKEVKK